VLKYPSIFLLAEETHNEFFYGIVYKNYSFIVELNEVLLSNYDIYLTLYNRSSLPVIWCQITEKEHTIPVVEQNGFYLVQIRPKISSAIIFSQTG